MQQLPLLSNNRHSLQFINIHICSPCVRVPSESFNTSASLLDDEDNSSEATEVCLSVSLLSCYLIIITRCSCLSRRKSLVIRLSTMTNGDDLLILGMR